MNYYIMMNNLIIFIISINLAKSKKIDFRFGILFMFESMMIFFMVLEQEFMKVLAEMVGMEYHYSLILLWVVTCSVYFEIYLTCIITDLRKTSSKLVQEMALISKRVEKLEKALSVVNFSDN